MKTKKNMWEEEEENQKQLVVGDIPLDIIDLYNLAVPFLKKDQSAEIKKLIRSTVDHLHCWPT